jgi:hypothetical protein
LSVIDKNIVVRRDSAEEWRWEVYDYGARIIDK